MRICAPPRKNRLCLAAVVLPVVAIALAGCGGGKHGLLVPTKAVVLTDRTWHCNTKVDLNLVKVTLHDGRQDAVHLDSGCTGTIRKLVVAGNGGDLGPGGDGVKVHPGVHDLQILAGQLDCGRKFARKHQDAIQAMGGKRVTFYGIVSRGCANSFMFINEGAGRHEIPNAIICRGCNAESRNYSVRVNRAIRSGSIDGTYVSRLKPNAGPAAVDPVLVDNRWTPRAGAASPKSGVKH